MSVVTALSSESGSSRRTTRKLVSAEDDQQLQQTDFELAEPSASAEGSAYIPTRAGPAPPILDENARELFRLRLRLCCLIGVFPFSLFFLSGITHFIELYGHNSIGWTGVVLGGVTLLELVFCAIFLTLTKTPPLAALRVIEIAVFGVMSLFFAYWHFNVLTATPKVDYEGVKHEEYQILAAAVTVHFNWFFVIIFHGVLVPNTPSRGFGVAIAMCLVALGIDAIAISIHAASQRYAWVILAIALTMLTASAGLSIFGTSKMAALRREVQSAREAVRQMGQYRLRRKLGSGGMGEVYLAEHHLLKRPCALKRIHAKYLNNPEQVARFQREVQATAQLRHPNTVEIYDYGISEDGTFYYVMEYLPGLSLEDLVARYGPQPPSRVVHILRQVCGALREAHRHGLIHRDIKPSNILIFAEGSPHDQVKLVDFGLVQSLVWEGTALPKEKITREGLIVGTPEYMSPEQASGSEMDGRSDLFSLGSVAYFLLTGREAFHRENPMKTLLAVVTDEPIPLQVANPQIPQDLAKIITQTLAKDVRQRFGSAYELDMALAGCLCSHDWTELRAKDWWDANPSAVPGLGTDMDMTAMTGEFYNKPKAELH